MASNVFCFSKVKAVLPNPFHFLQRAPASTQDVSWPSEKQKNCSRTLHRSSTDFNAAASSAPSPPNRQAFNVILFGEIGVGKSAIINLIAQRPVAELSSYLRGSLLQSTRYDIPFDGMNFSLFETIGLEEPRIGVNRYLEALKQAYELIVKLDAAGGVHLLLFILEAGKIRATTQSNYRLFFEAIFQTKVPIALVFTGLEREVEMEDWWRRNEIHIEHYGLKSDGHACITAVEGDNPSEDQKYVESQKRIRDLLKDFYPRAPAFRPDLDSWFAHLGNRMQSFIKSGRKPKRRDVANVLSKRVKLGQSKVQELLDMIRRSGAEPSDGDDERRPLVGTEDQERHDNRLMLRSVTTCVTPGQANAAECVDTDTLASARDLTGQVAKTHNRPFAAASYGDIYKGNLNVRGKLIHVAIKTYRVYLQHDEHLADKMKQFRRQVAVWLELEHSNVLPLLGTARDLGMNPDLPAMVYPWAENGALSTFLERNKDVTLAKRFDLINGVAHGLHYLHSRYIVHGGLSGANVLVHTDGRACIADYGLYTLMTKLRGSIAASGNPNGCIIRWAAPELFPLDGSHVAPSAQSDVYSFGSVMLQILTGDIPYHHLRLEEQVIIAIAMGNKPKRPDQSVVTDERWSFMEWCWSPVDAGKPRPSTDQMVEFTGKKLAAIMALAV